MAISSRLVFQLGSPYGLMIGNHNKDETNE
jgi:hypothetical protein